MRPHIERIFALFFSLCTFTTFLSQEVLANSQPPLRTEGRFIVDAQGQRVRLASVNWYGAQLERHIQGGLEQQSLAHIIGLIKQWGFNSVRLPFSNEMLRDERAVASELLAANPQLIGKTPLEVFDSVVEALTKAGLYVILNNHNTYSAWCCAYDNNGLWYHDNKGVPFALPVEAWEADWLKLVRRYQNNLMVVGVDLRNEVRTQKIGNTILPSSPNWGKGGANDWHQAAEGLGRRILELNPNLLIVVEGINWTGAIPILGSGERPHLRPIRQLPIRLQRPDKLVYGVHHYGYIGPRHNGDPKTSGNNPTYCEMDEVSYQKTLAEEWLFVLETEQFSTAPVWVSEFGASRQDPNPCEARWFARFMQVLTEQGLDFAYWPLNPDSYGLVSDDWSRIADNDWRSPYLKKLLNAPLAPVVPSPLFKQLSLQRGDDNQSSRQEDWLPGAHKASCPDGTRLIGLSRDLRGLCTNLATTISTSSLPEAKVVAIDEVTGTGRTPGDWASGFTKYECPLDHYVAGMSKHSWGLSGVLCLKSSSELAGSCQTLWFDKADQRLSEKGGDWALSSHKAQCSDDAYVAGIAQRDGRAAALLCCIN